MTYFDKYAQEGNIFIKDLAERLGHPNEISRSTIILRSVLHTLRDRITIEESFSLIAQFPMFLKALYVENWKYLETPIKLKTLDDFAAHVEVLQSKYGEQEFDWKKSTKEITGIVLTAIGQYVSEGESGDVVAQLPKGMKEFFAETMNA